MTERLCQAEIHHSRYIDKEGKVIPHIADSIDHFTPRCIAKLLELTQFEVGNYINHIPMNSDCHKLKDRSTPARKYLLKRILSSNIEVTLNDYRRFRNKHDKIFLK